METLAIASANRRCGQLAARAHRPVEGSPSCTDPPHDLTVLTRPLAVHIPAVSDAQHEDNEFVILLYKCVSKVIRSMFYLRGGGNAILAAPKANQCRDRYRIRSPGTSDVP
jgi:hypothetical protein